MTIYETSYTAAEGYTDGKLQFQDNDGMGGIWLGQAAAQVDTSGTGTATSTGGPFDRNLYALGARGGSGGVPNVLGQFTNGDVIGISFDYQFTLSGEGNRLLGKAGFRNEGPNAGNGFESAPQQGFQMEYNQFDAAGNPDDGNVKFRPVFSSSGNNNTQILEGQDVGIYPGDGVLDFVSDKLRINYEITKLYGSVWEVTGFTVDNLDQATSFSFTGPTQTINYSDTDAFFSQQLAVNGDAGFSGVTDGVVFTYNNIPEPSVAALGLLATLGLVRRRRQV